jgi:23S rRNA pseudouridine1911/1915/1917 synthase
MQEIHYTIDHQNAGKRLDLFLSEQALHLTRSQIKKLIDAHHVTVNHASAKSSFRIKKGDVIALQVQEPRASEVKAEDIPINIIFEDDFIIVVNKPAGMVVHPAAGNYSGTLVNALMFHSSFLSGVGGVLRPGIVHRLDKGTSGVLAIAKNDLAHQSLSSQFKNRSVKKIYTALVYGHMEKEDGFLESEIGRHYSDRKKMSIHTRKGRSAVTRWKVLDYSNNVSLLEVSIHTGRTHQIRVHLSSLHHPVVGDNVYGSKKGLSYIKNENIRKEIASLTRPFLHSRLLGFDHPNDNRYLEFIAPLPEELSNLLTLIESEK